MNARCRFAFAFAFAFALAMTLSSGASTKPAADEFEAAYAKAAPSIGLALAFDADRMPLESISGVFLDDRGTFATSLHALAGAASLRVKVPNGRFYHVSEAFAVDPTNDLILLKTNISGIPPLAFVNAEAGETVLPIGGAESVQGVWEPRTLLGFDPATGRFRLSGAIDAWADGGPVLNTEGKAIGLVTSPDTDQVIPARIVLRLAETANAPMPLAEAAALAQPRGPIRSAQPAQEPIPIPRRREFGARVAAFIGLLLFAGLGAEALSGI